MNKKGVKIPVETLIGISIFIVVLLFVFIPIFGAVYSFWFGNDISSLSKNNFKILHNGIKDLVNGDDSSSSLVLSFDDTVQVVGFDYDCDKNKDGDCPSLEVVKPSKCELDKACLCYFNGDDIKLKKPVSCKNFNEKVVFVVKKDATVGFRRGDNIANSEDMKFWLSPSNSGNFGTRGYLVNKSESNGVITLSFSNN